MAQGRRVFKTLLCLAAAMVGTAMLLAWLDPSSATAVNRLSPARIAQMARSAVGEQPRIVPGFWKEVRLVAEPSSSPSGTFLSSTGLPSDCHFWVDEHGRMRRLANWTHQVRRGPWPQSIKILIKNPLDDPPISAAQRLGVESVVQALGWELEVDPVDLPIRWPEEWGMALGRGAVER